MPVPQLRLHHVGLVVASIEKIAQVYVDRFGYKFASQIIHDPAQTAFVQFLQLAGDTSYLEFVSPDGPESRLAAAVARGGKLNHVCYTSGALEQAIEHLEENGMRLVSEPVPGVAFAGRRICWLLGSDHVPVELVERRDDADLCAPGLA